MEGKTTMCEINNKSESNQSSEFEEIILEAEGKQLRCNKRQLTTHSDYFKIMFEGNFIEKNKDIIRLEEVQFQPLSSILRLLWDENYIVSEESIFDVLRTANMLQFVKVVNMCVNNIQQMLSPTNCLTVWETCDTLGIKDLYLKAKSMALMEFNVIKDTDSILYMNLKNLYQYLANRNLQCENEMVVFQTCMKWWYENSTGFNRNDTLFTILTCVNFQSLSSSDIKEILSYPDIADNEHVSNILSCVLDIRENITLEYEECVVNRALVLSFSQPRVYPECPCFVMKGSRHRRKSTKFTFLNEDTAIVTYDMNSKEFRMFLPLENKSDHLFGHKFVCYKELIFLFGGEFLIGRGDWNTNLWAYDNIREKWERKCVVPFKRRHFEACICGDYLYVVGGTGEYRVLQENMFWYSYKEDKWSSRIYLPCLARQIKCCHYKTQLLLLCINNKCGYIFDRDTCMWTTIEIDDKDVIPTVTDEFALFSHGNSVYIKGTTLLEFKIEMQRLILVKERRLQHIIYDHMESVVCNDAVYTFYNKKAENEKHEFVDSVTFEKLDLNTFEVTYILDHVTTDTILNISDSSYSLGVPTKLFSLHNYKTVEKDQFITNYEPLM